MKYNLIFFICSQFLMLMESLRIVGEIYRKGMTVTRSVLATQYSLELSLGHSVRMEL